MEGLASVDEFYRYIGARAGSSANVQGYIGLQAKKFSDMLAIPSGERLLHFSLAWHVFESDCTWRVFEEHQIAGHQMSTDKARQLIITIARIACLLKLKETRHSTTTSMICFELPLGNEDQLPIHKLFNAKVGELLAIPRALRRRKAAREGGHRDR